MAILVKETDDRVNIVYEFDGTQVLYIALKAIL